MKKSFSIIFAVCFALFACAKQESQIGNETSDQECRLDYITAISPGNQVKTTVHDATKVYWADGDKIGMYADGGATAVYKTDLSEPSAQATFGRTSDSNPMQVDGLYYAVYPSSSVSQWALSAEETSGTICYVNVPKQQTAVAGSWDPKSAILVAASQTSRLTFKHVAAYLRFEVTEQTGEFVSVRLSSNNKEKLADSQAGVQILSTGEVSVGPGINSGDYVSLRNAEEDVAFEAGAYYIALLPGDFSGGLTLTFQNAEGLIAEKSCGALTLNPGEVSDWGQVETLTFVKGKTPLQVATVYKENGLNQGVVYWVDPDNPYKGKIVSVSSAEAMEWSENLKVNYLWTDKIESQEDGLLNYEQFNASEVYTGQKEKFYALDYCEKMRETNGGNWYLPAPKELRTLCQVYYGLPEAPAASATETDYRFENSALVPSVMSAKAEFDSALNLLGETTTATLDGDADADGVCDNAGYGDEKGVTYWTSKVNTGGPVQYVNFGVYYLTNTKNLYKTGYVRCVRDVDLNGGSGSDDGDSGDGGDSGDDGDDSDDGNSEEENDEVNSGIDPLDPFDVMNMPIRVSLVGDSITSYEGTLVTNFENSENGGAYYPTGNVTSVENQYWHKLIYGRMSNAVLEVNNSLRGSCVVRRDTHPDVDYPARVSLYGLGNPDLVLIHGGTNDCTKHSADYAPRPGMYRADMYPGDAYSGMAPASLPTDAEFKVVYDAAEAASTWEEILALEDGYFIHAYVKLLNMIHFKHPNAKVVIIIGDTLTKRAQQALLKIAEHYEQLYGYKCVNFFGLSAEITKASGVHPDDAGFTYMADKIYEEVGAYINTR